MAGIDYRIGLNPAGLLAGVRASLGGLGQVAGRVASIASPIAAIAGVASLGASLAKAVGQASQMETLETAFQPLLGSAAAAQERIAELSRFSASTPFQMPQVATASRTLETLTKGALSTGDGLRVVGDVAAAVGMPIDQMSTTIGRLYDGLDSGRPVGEALARLQELGVISGDTRGQIEALQAEGKKGQEVWAVAESALGRFSGSMALQSQTWGGKMSTLQDNIGLAFAAFGKPIIDAAGPFLDKTIATVAKMAEGAGAFAGRIVEAFHALSSAVASGQIGEFLLAQVQLGFGQGINFLAKSFQAWGAGAGQYLAEIFTTGPKILEVVTRREFWQGVGDALVGLFQSAIAALLRGVEQVMSALAPVANVLGQGDAFDGGRKAVLGAAADLEGRSADRFESAADPLRRAGDDAARALADAGGRIGETFRASFSSAGDLIDTSGAESARDSALAKIQDRRASDRAARLAAVGPDEASPAPAAPAEGADAIAAAVTRASGASAADRLAQIGGFVGRQTDRAAEETARYAKATAEGIRDLIRIAATRGGEQSAVF